MKIKQKNGKKLTLFVDTDVRDAARSIAEADRTSVSSLFEELVLLKYKEVFKKMARVRPPEIAAPKKKKRKAKA
jgi:hypothetical protein